uniref:Immunoglobulin domain-containing protein n=1 Tax=Neovison vison TaxID=452646 RepID=A0A8C7BRK9_NEOVI
NTMSPRVISLACLGETNTVPPPPPGGQNKPFLSAWPSPVVPQGQHVTLHCRSHHKFEAFRLYKDNDIFISKLHSTISQYGVLIGPVTPEHAGTYSCQGSYHNSPSLWSAPSDPLVIVVTGIYRKPSLLAQSGRLVKSRGNVTLVCCSEILFESFILHREGVSKDHLYRAGQHHHGGSHANFSMGPVTAAHAGTYRCFGSLNHSSHVWSAPSDPLDIMITGETVQTSEDPQEVTYTQLDHRIFMQKNTTPTSQRPGEPLHDENQSRHKSYAPRTHKKTLRRLSIDAIALSEHTPTQQQPESEDRSLHLPLILRRNNNLRKPPIPSRILL